MRTTTRTSLGFRKLQHAFRFVAAALVSAPALGLTEVSAQRWVNPQIVGPPTNQTQAPPNTGYLRLLVTAQLDGLQTPPYRHIDNKIQLLAVNIEVNPNAGSASVPVDYPVALYDIRAKERTEVAAFALGKDQYVNLNSSSQPIITFRVRAVPQTLASSFKRAVNQFNEVVSNPSVSTLVPIPPQVTAISGILTSFLGEATDDNPSWVSSRPVGLTNDGGMQVIPLDGTRIAIFLLPPRATGPFASNNGVHTTVPTWSQIEVCSSDQTRLCSRQNRQPLANWAYLIASASLRDYRPLTDFGAPILSCTSTEADFSVLEEVVRRAALTPEQRVLEDRLVERYRLVRTARGDGFANTEKTAALAFRWTRRYQGAGDTYWTTHAKSRADQFDRCVETEVTNAGPAVYRKWSYLRDAFTTADTWQTIAPQRDPEARRIQLEGFLSTILRPIDAYGLQQGEAYAILRDEQARIERELLVGTNSLLSELAQASGAAQLRSLRQRIVARSEGSSCQPCKNALLAAQAQIDGMLAADATATATLAARQELSDAQQEATQVAGVAAAANVVTPAVAGLRDAQEVASRLLNTRDATAADLQQSTRTLRDATTAVRAQIQS